jgi:hypothetical protein
MSYADPYWTILTEERTNRAATVTGSIQEEISTADEIPSWKKERAGSSAAAVRWEPRQVDLRQARRDRILAKGSRVLCGRLT